MLKFRSTSGFLALAVIAISLMLCPCSSYAQGINNSFVNSNATECCPKERQAKCDKATCNFASLERVTLALGITHVDLGDELSRIPMVFRDRVGIIQSGTAGIKHLVRTIPSETLTPERLYLQNSILLI